LYLAKYDYQHFYHELDLDFIRIKTALRSSPSNCWHFRLPVSGGMAAIWQYNVKTQRLA